jgi:hypothetical protein
MPPTDHSDAVGGRIGRIARSLGRFRRDERAIEGLPVRLVVALVVGVASLGLMMNMLTGIQGLGVTELDVRPDPDVVEPGSQSIELTVVGPEGDPVPGATVVVKGGGASLEEGVVTAETDDAGVASVEVTPRLLDHQQDGTLVVELKPPSGSEYVDRRGNTEILVVRG